MPLTLQEEVALLTTATTNLISEVSTKKVTLDTAVTNAQTAATTATSEVAKVTGMTVAQGAIGSQPTWDGVNGILTIPQGDTGVSILPQGTDTVANIQLATPTTGHFYTASDTGDGYMGNGIAWVNIGNIKGAQGIQGVQGVQGIQGVAGADGTFAVAITQAAYDALGTPNPDTLYIING